jgi:hypothetical protein
LAIIAGRIFGNWSENGNGSSTTAAIISGRSASSGHPIFLRWPESSAEVIHQCAFAFVGTRCIDFDFRIRFQIGRFIQNTTLPSKWPFKVFMVTLSSEQAQELR